MFTGIIEEVGKVRAATPSGNGVQLTVVAAKVLEDLEPGASIALEGVCQTVLSCDARSFKVAAELETLRVTTLGELRAGDEVNLERALSAAGRFDGHMVLGHVDGRGRILAVRQESRTQVLEVEVPAALRDYVVTKGCIAINGVSLTVGPVVREGRFEVYLIPYTWEHTTLHALRTGDFVNIETDIVARYVVHLLQGRPQSSNGGITWDHLERAFGRGEGR